MATLPISDALAERLRAIAARENRSLDDLLAEFADQREPDDDSLQRLGQAARELNLQASDPTISVRSREILETEYADYLASRLLKRGDDDQQNETAD